jgi:hypothetical protein
MIDLSYHKVKFLTEAKQLTRELDWLNCKPNHISIMGALFQPIRSADNFLQNDLKDIEKKINQLYHSKRNDSWAKFIIQMEREVCNSTIRPPHRGNFVDLDHKNDSAHDDRGESGPGDEVEVRCEQTQRQHHHHTCQHVILILNNECVAAAAAAIHTPV